MTENNNRAPSALFKRAEQLRRWEASDTNRQSPMPRFPARIKFSSRIVFLAACSAGDKEEVQRLLKSGADINMANLDGLTALHQACIDDNLDMVEFLVSQGADVNRRDNEGWTPLHATASCGFISIARYLMENGADVAAVNYDGDLAVDIAESKEMIALLKKVIAEKGIDCEMARKAEVNSLKADAKYWAENGYVEVRDMKTGGTALHVAAAKGYNDVAKTLLEVCNVDPDCVDYDGWTPLHAAALWGKKEAAALLIKNGADPHLKNYAGLTCLDVADPSISSWLAEESMKAVPRRINNNNNNNNNKRKRSPPNHEVKRADIEISGNVENNAVNARSDNAPAAPEIINLIDSPPTVRAPPPNTAEDSQGYADDSPSWRRSSFRRQRAAINSGDNNVENAAETESNLRRTHSLENDKAIDEGPVVRYLVQQYESKKRHLWSPNLRSRAFIKNKFKYQFRHVTERNKSSSCSSIPPLPNSNVSVIELRKKLQLSSDDNEIVKKRVIVKEKPQQEANLDWTSLPSTSSNAASSNTQTTVRSSTDTESNSSNSTPSAATPTKLSPGNIFKNFFKSFVPPVRDEESETQRKAHAKRVRETRRSTQGVTLDEIKSAEQLVKKKTSNGTTESSVIVNNKQDENTPPSNDNGPFELEDASRAPPRAPATEATVTLPLRRPPAGSSANTVAPTSNEQNDGEKDRESSSESKASSNSSASTQAALNVIQRRRRPKRRSTGVGHVDMEDIVNDRAGGGEGDGEENVPQSGTERTEESDRDYKALYEASENEVRRLRALLATSEQHLREARETITRLTQVNSTPLSELEKRGKRAMERKLSEMEEELKHMQKLKAENERLRAENQALTRVVSRLTNSAPK